MSQVDELMGVLEDQGSAVLETYPLQKLSWEQVKELKGPNLVGLGMGSGPAPGEIACLAHICSPSLAVCGCDYAFMGPSPNPSGNACQCMRSDGQ